MWFKKLTALRFEKPLHQLECNTYKDADALHDALSKMPFADCTPTQRRSSGWVKPLGQEAELFTHQSGSFILITMAIQERALPASAVREKLKALVTEIQDRESRKVGSKEKKELTERIEDELLPRAFKRTTKIDAFIDINNGLLVVNSATDSKVDALATLLRKTVGSLPVTRMIDTFMAGVIMTDWLSRYEIPAPFYFGEECHLKSIGDDNATASFRNHALGADEVKANIEAGKTVSKLAINWDKKINILIDDELIISKLQFCDVLEEKMSEEDPQSHQERLDIEFTIMAMEISKLLADLTKAMSVSKET